MKTLYTPTKLFLLVIVGIAFDARADLIIDGGFENPGVPVGGNITYSVGETIDSVWTVIGSPLGNISVLSEFQNAGPNLMYTAHTGVQEIDLTGGTDNGAATGLEQTISTVTGFQYTLDFWVGNVNASPPDWPASVAVQLDGITVETVTNTNVATYGSSGVAPANWELFSYNFTATGNTTTVGFLDNVPADVGFNGLDDVSVNAAASPEPSTMFLLGAGLLLIGIRRDGNRSRGEKVRIAASAPIVSVPTRSTVEASPQITRVVKPADNIPPGLPNYRIARSYTPDVCGKDSAASIVRER
jgi:hypothetical protein